MGTVLLTPPAEPVASLEEARLQTRSANPNEDGLLTSAVAGATTWAEAFCRRRFVTQKWRLTLDEFPERALVLPFPPLATVESVKYVDSAGVVQTISHGDYVARTSVTPGEVVPAYGKYWPSARGEEDAVRVEFTCGYGAAANVPEAIRRAVLLIVGTLYEQRASMVTGTIATLLPHNVEWLLGPYRVVRYRAA